MSKQNIWEVTELVDLAELLKNNTTVVVGLATETTPKSDKITVRKFLKDKSTQFQHIIFVYMEVHKYEMGKLGIISSDETVYPLVYHIRDSKVAVKVDHATSKTLNESFAMVEPYYLAEKTTANEIHQDDQNSTLDPALEKRKIIDKALFIDQKCEELKVELIREVQRRKMLEQKLTSN